MSLKARIREIDGKDVIVAGPSESIKKEHINDTVVDCTMVYEQNFDLLFPTYIGPTCTVETNESGQKYVKMFYTAVESELEVVKAQLISKIMPIFDIIDSKSTRAVRAIIYANTTGTTPNQMDIDVAKQCEETAVANRNLINTIKNAESLAWLHEHLSELQPINPWAQNDPMRPPF